MSAMTGLIEDMQRNIESQCLSLLTRQTPVARDLRNGFSRP